MHSRRPWGSSGALSSGQRAHPVEFNVHELRAVQGTASSKSVIVDGPDDSLSLSKERGESKFAEDVV